MESKRRTLSYGLHTFVRLDEILIVNHRAFDSWKEEYLLHLLLLDFHEEVSDERWKGKSYEDEGYSNQGTVDISQRSTRSEKRANNVPPSEEAVEEIRAYSNANDIKDWTKDP